VITSSQIWDMV